MTRRDTLRLAALAGAAAALAACTSEGGASPTDPGGPEDPDRGLRAEIGRDETALIALYAAAAEALSGERAALVAELGRRHAAYRQAIDPDGLATQPPSSTSGSTTATASPTSTALPDVTAATAVPVLLRAEQRAAQRRAAQCVRAVDAELARVVALAGAGCATAAAVLEAA